MSTIVLRVATLRDGASRLLRVRRLSLFRHDLILRSGPQGRVSKDGPHGDAP